MKYYSLLSIGGNQLVPESSIPLQKSYPEDLFNKQPLMLVSLYFLMLFGGFTTVKSSKLDLFVL